MCGSLDKIKVVLTPVCQKLSINWNYLPILSMRVCLNQTVFVKPLSVLYVGGIDRVHASVLWASHPLLSNTTASEEVRGGGGKLFAWCLLMMMNDL